MSERRLSNRLPVHLPVSYQCDEVTIPGLVSNLSRTGLFLRSDFLDDAGGREVSIDLRLPGDHEPLALVGEVVRVVEDSGRAGMGIRFSDLAPTVRRRLANFAIAASYQALA